MYLYFDRVGALREIINDEALRQGNYGVNKMYIFIDRDNVSSIDVSYLLPNGTTIQTMRYATTQTSTIPYNAKRDLRFFKYFKQYTFFVVDLEMDVYGNSPLDIAGVVHASLNCNLTNGDLLQLGDVNFNVVEDSVLNQKNVASEEYLSLANYLFLKKLINYQDYSNYVLKYSSAPSDWDTVPTEDSTKPITSGGVFEALLDTEKMRNVTHFELTTLVRTGKLVKGMLYRITDYVCTTSQSDEFSCTNHQFDIVVQALSENTLSEEARAIKHDGDTYFTSCNLNAWKLRYSIFNDATRFEWADTENGKGVIYYMQDEWGNECPYDFKNIRFKIHVDVDGTYDASGTAENVKNVYTFSYLYSDGNVVDTSIVGNNGLLVDDEGNILCVYNNKIKEYYGSLLLESGKYKQGLILNRNIFFSSYAYEGLTFYGCNNNSFDLGCARNVLQSHCDGNTFGKGCKGNVLKNACRFNHFGDDCNNNVLGISCESNVFGNGCTGNELGELCGENHFLGMNSYNVLVNHCSYNSFYLGSGNIRLGAYSNTNVFEERVQYLNIRPLTSVSDLNPVRYVIIKPGVHGASSLNPKIIDVQNNRTYTQTFKASGSTETEVTV